MFVVLGGNQARLGPLDLAGDLVDRERGARALAADQRAEEAAFAAQHLRRLSVVLGGIAPQLRQRDAVERAGGRRCVDAEVTQPGDALARGLAGEREREHMACVGGTFAHSIRDATREHARFSRPGGRNDRERRRARRDRGALAGVEIVEQVITHEEMAPSLRRPY